MDGALYHGRVCSVGGCLDSQRRPILDNRPVALLQGTGYVPSASRSDYKDRRCHAPGCPRARGAPLTLAAGPATLRAGKVQTRGEERCESG